MLAPSLPTKGCSCCYVGQSCLCRRHTVWRQTHAYILVNLVYEGLQPVLVLPALPSCGKGAAHAVVDDGIVLVLLKQGRACIDRALSAEVTAHSTQLSMCSVPFHLVCGGL